MCIDSQICWYLEPSSFLLSLEGRRYADTVHMCNHVAALDWKLWVCVYCISRNFRGVFIFANFASWILNAKIKIRQIYSLHSSMNEKFVPQMTRKYNTALSVNAKLLNLEGLSLHSSKSKGRFQHAMETNIPANISFRRIFIYLMM